MESVVAFHALPRGTVVRSDGAVGPTLTEQMEFAGVNAQIAVAEAIARRAIMPDRVQAGAERLLDDLIEGREALLDDFTKRYGRAVTDSMVMMQYAALGHAAARAIELRFDGE